MNALLVSTNLPWMIVLLYACVGVCLYFKENLWKQPVLCRLQVIPEYGFQCSEDGVEQMLRAGAAPPQLLGKPWAVTKKSSSAYHVFLRLSNLQLYTWCNLFNISSS